MFTNIGLHLEAPLARIEFCRPDTHNAFDQTTHNEFCQALTTLRRDQSIRAILIHAQGRAFIGGGDMGYLQNLHENRAFRERTGQEAFDIFTLLNDIKVPLIAAVQGHALGFGATIATSCDVIVAYKDAKFADPHVRAGIVAGDGGVLSWAAVAGFNRAKRLLLTGDAITAAQAHAFNIVTDLVDTPEDAYPTALAIATRIAALPPMAVQGTKHAFNALAKQRNGNTVELSLLAENISLAAADTAEAISALAAKRVGNYRGS